MNRLFAVCVVLCVGSLGVKTSASAQCLPISVDNPDGNYIVPGVQGGIVYRRVDERALAMDAYVQQRGLRRPAVVVVHGGGWDTGSRVAFTGQLLELLTRAGYNWFAIDYRLRGLANFTDAVDDVAAAVSFVRCHAAEFRIDPNNLALLGEDAGAHLSLLLAEQAPAGVRAVAAIGAFYDLTELSGFRGRYDATLLRRASPTAHPLGSMPATMLVHGGDDTEVPSQQAGRFCEALREAGRSCVFTTVEGGIHRPENWRPSQWQYKEQLVAWLNTVLQLREPNHEPYRTRLRKAIVFSPAHGLTMDVFTPAGGGPFPVVVIAHGGGWEAGDRVTYVTPVFESLAKAGFAWASIDYRLTPAVRNRDQIDDLRDAVQFVRRRASEWRIDPTRLAILGESASGQMVATLAAEKPAGVAAVVSFYGVYDFLQMAASITPRSVPTRLFGVTELTPDSRALLARASPLQQAQPGMPAFLLVQGTADRLYPQAVAFAERLAALNVPYFRYDVADAPHGMENWEGHDTWVGYKQVLVDWLRKALHQP